jgi:hypothetical protein
MDHDLLVVLNIYIFCFIMLELKFNKSKKTFEDLKNPLSQASCLGPTTYKLSLEAKPTRMGLA